MSVYFLFDESRKYVKIGFTTKTKGHSSVVSSAVEKMRWRNGTRSEVPISGAQLVSVYDGGSKEESDLHAYHAMRHSFFEWFHAYPVIVRQAIGSLPVGDAFGAYDELRDWLFTRRLTFREIAKLGGITLIGVTNVADGAKSRAPTIAAIARVRAQYDPESCPHYARPSFEAAA